jgi:predicted protein tyrosine phosphatase
MEAAEFTLDTPWATISITDPGSPPAKLHEDGGCQDVLRLEFWDLDRPALGYKDNLFTPEDARQIIRFAKKWAPKVDTIMTHCEAGISRSAAVAAFLSKVVLGEDGDYFTRAYPNRLVFRTLMKTWGNGR